jgi:hypothetical protein
LFAGAQAETEIQGDSMNRAAQSLGRRAKGVPKRFSAEELAKRTERIKAARREFLAKPKPKAE